MRSARPLRILRLLLTVGETSAPYNQFSLAWRDRHDITLCTLFEPTVSTPAQLRVFDGHGSVTGFLRALREALREGEYDVVHAHSPHVAFLFLVATLFSRRPSPPTVFTLHTSYPNVKLRNRLLLVPVFARFRRLVCCSQSSLESLPRFFRWLGGSRLCAVRNGLDVERLDRALAGRPRERREGDFNVVSVGRLMALKNPLVILRAFRETCDPNSRLRFIGAGPLHDAILQASRASGHAQRVEITGVIPRERVYAALCEADLYVSGSHCEGLPVSALEAMACRCPVLLSDSPPHREIADGADFIPLVSPDDGEGFARELKRFRAMSAETRLEIGEKCRKLVEERFGLGEMERGYEAVYSEVRAGA